MSQTTIDLDFSDLTPYCLPFEYEGVRYELREPSCLAKKKFSNERLARVSFKGGETTSARDMGDLEPILLSLCVFKEGDTKPVPIHTLESWNGRVTGRLYEAAKKIAFEKDEPDLPISQLVEALKTESPPQGLSLEVLLDWVKTLPIEYKLLKDSMAKVSLDPKAD